ncbi:MAG: TonB-dependent receptor plug domain-containing protein [Xanthomonadales bacterium]|jgi:iron complex outermembrane receptor protein|nr:TonB-dependent receptor plug domain-containing protein [Xanthomonadales bacterium]
MAAMTSAAVQAGPGSAELGAESLPEVEVHGSALRDDLDPNSPRNPYRLPSSSRHHVQLITREMIEQIRPRDVFELLDNATGVQATQSSRKGFSGLNIRGDSEFRWILDGAMLQPTMASRILRALPVAAIEQVEVIRGGSALTLGPMVGSASPGGAPVDGFVVLRTRKPSDDEAQLRLALESNDTAQASVWGGVAREEGENRHYAAGLIAYHRNGSPDDRLDNGATYNVDRRSNAGLAKLGLERAGWLIDFLAFLDSGEFQIPNANSRGLGQGSWYMDPSRTRIAILSGSKRWDDRHTTVFALSHSRSEQTFWTANTPAGPYASVQNDNKVTHLNLRHHLDFQQTRLQVGGDYLHWNAPTGQQYYEGIPREEKTLGIFAQVERSFLEDRFRVDFSTRRDRVDVIRGLDYYTGGRQPFGGVNSPLITRDKLLPPASFLSAGFNYELTQAWNFSARYGRSRQRSDGLNPRPGVIFGDDQQRKYEFGIEGRPWASIQTSLNAFRRQVENEKVQDGYTYLAVNNSSQVCTRAVIPASGPLSPRDPSRITPCYGQQDTLRAGLEWTLSSPIPDGGNLRLSWTRFTDFENSREITPRNIADLSVSQPLGPVQLNATLRHVSAYRGATADMVAGLGGYTRYDLGVAHERVIGETPVRFSLYGRNLGDRRFETRNGVQDIGRVLGFEVIAAF